MLLPLWAVLPVSLPHSTEFLDALPYAPKQAAPIADLFLQMVPGFLLSASAIVYLWSRLAFYMLKLEKRGYSRLCSGFVGASLNSLVVPIAFVVVQAPLQSTELLPLSARLCYVVTLTAAFWWHEVKPMLRNWANRLPFVRLGRKARTHRGDSCADLFTENCRNTRLAQQMNEAFHPLEAALLLLAVCAGACLLASTLLPTCPQPLHDWVETVCDLPCGISRMRVGQ